jgi:hypothetical protein
MCMICHEKGQTRYISLFVIGSEGITVCHSCEMKIVEYIRLLMQQEFEKKKQKFLNK